MLAHLQKWLDKPEAEVACERKKTALERDVAACVHDQLLAQMEVLRKARRD